MKVVSHLSLVILLASCQKAVQDEGDKPVFRKQTATEIFELKTKCSELGDKLLNLNPVSLPFAHEQTSHYDPSSNNCYVEITVHPADLSNPTWKSYWSDTVFDGQSRDTLAWMETKEGKISAWVKDGPLNATGTLALLKIKALMTSDPEAERAYRLSAAVLNLRSNNR